MGIALILGLVLALAAALAGGAADGPRPTAAAATGPDHPDLFQTSDHCFACHKGVADGAGRDVSIAYAWRASMMANSSRDPYWQAGVRRETLDHPTAAALIEDECSICHMPMARYQAVAEGGAGQVFANLPGTGADGPFAALAADGVSCALCHQIRPDGFGSRSSFVGGFKVAGPTTADARTVYGPFQTDDGRRRVMRSASGFEPELSPHVQKSELCATCHTLFTKAMNERGEEVGELPEQVPFQEWKHSSYADQASCQACHMPEVEHEVAVTSVLGQPRAHVSTHGFDGGNFFMLRMLNRHRDELAVAALPQELDAAAERTVEFLATRAAAVSVRDARLDEDGRLEADVIVGNRAGHKLPSAYPSRRAWLHVTVRDADGRVVFESGAQAADGRVVGNDNDDDAARYEPHRQEVTRPDQVQIYEGILADSGGRVTTGLLTAVGYLKDNRLLPAGFDKATAGADIAVHGEASGDADFQGGGDRVRYRVDVTGGRAPFTVEAELRYQPIGFRWAHNLAGYDAPEPRRFVAFYRGMADASSTVLARAVAEVAGG